MKGSTGAKTQDFPLLRHYGWKTFQKATKWSLAKMGISADFGTAGIFIVPWSGVVDMETTVLIKKIAIGSM